MHVKESVQCRSGAVAVELQVELWGSPGPEAVTCWPSAHNKGPGDLWLGQGAGHGDTAGAEDPRLLCPDCEGIKAKGFLFIGPPPQRNQLELLFSYLVIAPGWNYFKNLSVWDSAMETLGLSPYGKPECVCVCVCELQGFSPAQVMHKSDCHSDPGCSAGKFSREPFKSLTFNIRHFLYLLLLLCWFCLYFSSFLPSPNLGFL